MTAGALAMFFAAFVQAHALMRVLLQNAGQLYSNSLFLGNLFQFLALEEEPQPGPSSLVPGPSSGRGATANLRVAGRNPPRHGPPHPRDCRAAFGSRLLISATRAHRRRRSRTSPWMFPRAARRHRRPEWRREDHDHQAAVPVLRAGRGTNLHRRRGYPQPVRSGDSAACLGALPGAGQVCRHGDRKRRARFHRRSHHAPVHDRAAGRHHLRHKDGRMVESGSHYRDFHEDVATGVGAPERRFANCRRRRDARQGTKRAAGHLNPGAGAPPPARTDDDASPRLRMAAPRHGRRRSRGPRLARAPWQNPMS